MVKRGHEVDLEYSKKEIMDRMNNFFRKTVVEKIKFTSFEEDTKISTNTKTLKKNATKNKYHNKINNLKNDKIKKSLLELTKVFKEK
jgi:hypothetical protein